MFLNTEFILNCIIHMFIMFTFLSLLYIYYISKVQSDAFNYEVKHLMDDNFKYFFDSKKIPEDLIERIRNEIDRLPYDKILQQSSVPDPYTELNNKWLFNTLFSYIFIISFIIIFIIVFLFKKCENVKIDIKKILYENIITFIFIGIIEYYFFTMIAFKFTPVPPSVLATSFIERFKTMLVLKSTELSS